MTTQTLDDLAGSDYIDPRDLEARKEELEGERDQYVLDKLGGIIAASEASDEDEARQLAAWPVEFPEGAAELDELTELCDELLSVIQEQEGLIADHAFEDYARELAEDIGAIDRDAGWPLGYIDWERAAEALQSDYSSYTIRGTDYWARA